MRITAIDTHLVQVGSHRRANQFLFVEVHTDTGLTGVGEAGVWGALEPCRTAIEWYADYLVGKDPLAREDHFQHIYRWSHFRGAAIIGALSAVDIAFWDIAGKHHDAPVHELLGGACRDKARVYVHAFGETTDELVEECIATRDQGFTAVGHLSPLLDEPHDTPYFETHAELVRDGVERVRAFREAVGTDVDLCIEIHRRLDPEQAIALGRELEPYHPMFFEDPVPPHNFDAMAQVAEKTNLPIATGERLHTIHEFEHLLARNAVHYVRPNLGHTGGITQAKKIAGIAEAHHAGVVPHNPLGPVLSAASLQLVASIPNFPVLEFPYRPRFEETKGENLITSSFDITDGFVHVPTTPGIGVELDHDALDAYADQYESRMLDTRRHVDGSVVDQ